TAGPKVMAGRALSSSASKASRHRAGDLRVVWGLRDSNILRIPEGTAMRNFPSVLARRVRGAGAPRAHDDETVGFSVQIFRWASPRRRGWPAVVCEGKRRF